VDRRWPPPAAVDGIFGAHAQFVAEPEPVTATVEEITDEPARTFRRWALDHAREFREATARSRAIHPTS
jgi:hypothetical protein